jgi:hypothetical protein
MRVMFFNGREGNAKQCFNLLLELELLVDTTKMVPFTCSGLECGSAVGDQWRKANFRGSAIAPFEENFFCNLNIWWVRWSFKFIIEKIMTIGNRGTAFEDTRNHVNDFGGGDLKQGAE